MAWIPDRYRDLRALIGGARAEREVTDEIEQHIALRIADNVSHGMSPDAARAEALRRFGDVNAYRNETRVIDERAARGRRRLELRDTLSRESRLAVRALRRTPAFTLVVVTTLALGIGAATAIFTLLDAVVLRPLPYPVEDRLVWIDNHVSGNTTGPWSLSQAGYFYYRDHSRTLDAIGVYTLGDAPLVTGDGADVVPVAQASAPVFDVLGLRTVLGRAITSADDRPGAGTVVVLSHRFWMQRFHGDSGVVGRRLRLGDESRTIVGVLAPGEEPPRGTADLWLTLNLDPAAPAENSHYLSAVARLRPGVRADAAQHDLAQLTARFPELFPSAYSVGFMRQYHFTPQVVALRAHVVGEASRGIWIVLAAAAMLLLVSCANVANLFLVRLESRRREVAIRTAVGADRTHLAWHYLTESVLLCLVAGAGALLLANAAIHGLLTLAPANLPRLDGVRLGWPSVICATILALATGVTFGLLPVFRSRIDLATLRDSSRGLSASRGQRSARSALVVAQTALALLLLAAAGLMVRSFVHLRDVRPGFDARGVLAIDVGTSAARGRTYESAEMFWHTLLARLAALPGVAGVGAVSSLPIDGPGVCAVVIVQAHPLAPGEQPPCVDRPLVTPGYFAAMGIPVRGAAPSWSDVENHVSGVVVSKALADRLWPGEDPIGQGINAGGQPPFFRVVGVAGDVRAQGLDQPPAQAVYYPIVPVTGAFMWGPARGLTIVVRGRGGGTPTSFLPAIRRVLREIDPEAPIANVRTMDFVVSHSMARLAFTMLLLGVAAGMALLLSAVGMYGVISYLVGQRRGEMGIRVALGARASQVSRLVVFESVRLAAIGVALGLAGAVVMTRIMRSLLFEVSPTDPLTLVLVSAILLAIAAAASWAPARRASRVDPIEALRVE